MCLYVLICKHVHELICGWAGPQLLINLRQFYEHHHAASQKIRRNPSEECSRFANKVLEFWAITKASLAVLLPKRRLSLRLCWLGATGLSYRETDNTCGIKTELLGTTCFSTSRLHYHAAILRETWGRLHCSKNEHSDMFHRTASRLSFCC